MRATAAVLYEVKKPLVVEDVEVLEPGAHHAFGLMLEGEVTRSMIVYE
jgi:Zn-dependent alcohol dehydrogenase